MARSISYEIGVERKTDDVKCEDDAHDVHLDIFQGHEETAESSKALRINICQTNIFCHAQLCHLKFVRSESACVVRQIGQDKECGNGDCHGSSALN